MQLLILAAVAAVAFAAPDYSKTLPSEDHSSEEVVEVVVPILRDDRVQEEDGRFSVDVETGNGIVLSESGSPAGPDGAVVMAGAYAYTAPDGTLVELRFVADENGYQPESALLPVAPEFPHPIPQFVLDQIAFAAEEDAAEELANVSVEEVATTYAEPSSSEEQVPAAASSVNEAPAAPISVNEAPAAPATVYEAPTAPISVYEAPAAPLSVYEAPAAPLSVYEAPAAPLSVYEAPTAPATVYEAPAAPLSVYEAPTAPATVYEAPTAPVSVYEAPAAPATVYQAPAAPATVYQAPAAPATVYQVPV
ncbi:uncharacterized protein LOC126987686 [Eriocheir sinensis]|uniref:uncharacterized protein LOC126987686 n=1 Tax=Eriocheir sinensis TaxID=95602 RepID=UPI0021C9FA60|nr:uncharacterized protein LOC126987686 [Eriocheir sinensis]